MFPSFETSPAFEPPTIKSDRIRGIKCCQGNGPIVASHLAFPSAADIVRNFSRTRKKSQPKKLRVLTPKRTEFDGLWLVARKNRVAECPMR
jgi:hypothetical protein